jgi:hypothetical protein
MDLTINGVIQWFCQAILWLVGILFRYFALWLLLAMLIYVIWNWETMKAFWKMTYAKIDQQMNPTFQKIESTLTKFQGKNNETTNQQ